LAEERQEALNLIAALEVVLSSLMNIAGRTASVSKWAAALGAAGEALAPKFWVGPAGDAMSELLAEIGAASGPPLTLKDFGVLLAEAARGRAVRPRARAHPRLAIWGPLEARLQSADLIILGALNEGVWPAIPDVDPWANRAMRKAMGLSPPERWVGVAAHDFEALAAAHHVLLTAAERVDGSPSRPSRFLMRLQNFLSPRGGRALLAPPPHAGWARQLVRAEVYRPVAPPAPKPPVVMRPRKFSITEIATLRRDPYAIYTKHVLRLKPLEPIDADTLARDRGNLLHAILEKFVRAYPDALPADARAAFDKIAAAQLAQEQIEPEAAPLIRARLSRAATKYLEWEVTHRLSARPLDQEAKGAIDLPVPGGTVRLTGRIDRIDADRATGAALIFDYKTGRTPSKRQVEAMLEPQLPLGALIALKGGLETAHPRAVMRLAYLQIGGGAGEIEEPRFDDAQPLIDETWAELLKLLASYDDQAKPYRSWAIREREHDRGDYDLLARLAEWRNSGGDE
jgi:ATP-dependent helicase/nuclease subunit B